MPSFCSVVKCSMRAERDSVRFFRIPASLKGRGDMLDALSNERRDLWIKSLKRGPLTDTFLKNARIWSRHFINGAPAELEDKGNPDWVPNQNMGYVTIKTVTKKAVEGDRAKLEINAEESKTGIDPGKVQCNDILEWSPVKTPALPNNVIHLLFTLFEK